MSLKRQMGGEIYLRGEGNQDSSSLQVIMAALNEEEGIGLTISELIITLKVLGFWLLTAEALIEPLR